MIFNIQIFRKFFIIIIFFNNLNSLEFSKRVCTNLTRSCRQFSTKKPPVVIHYDHIFGLNKFSGFHHDYKGILEAKGYFHLKNTKQMANGVYHGKILRKLPNGHKIHITKSFFPSDWTQQQVLEKIYEAYNNYDQELTFTYNKAVIVSQTNEGLKIKMVITNQGEILTAFPIIDSDED